MCQKMIEYVKYFIHIDKWEGEGEEEGEEDKKDEEMNENEIINEGKSSFIIYSSLFIEVNKEKEEEKVDASNEKPKLEDPDYYM